ncbi:hypothetical protein PENTCL1PPCAC_21079 [Pristionchus entomophagus]|uniref:Uncharacterized protein n=1 Tax=Pristionchus entomophagus TaxID=358040 RepID=A0AAV5TY51_9BILA|nr:hypothetical protein PENTCL1PPCAC_21079 [Pristionchus entomophagus]
MDSGAVGVALELVTEVHPAILAFRATENEELLLFFFLPRSRHILPRSRLSHAGRLDCDEVTISVKLHFRSFVFEPAVLIRRSGVDLVVQLTQKTRPEAIVLLPQRYDDLGHRSKRAVVHPTVQIAVHPNRERRPHGQSKRRKGEAEGGKTSGETARDERRQRI